MVDAMWVWVAVTVVLAWVVKDVLMPTPKKLHGVYSVSGSVVAYWWRWCWKVVEVWLLQVSRKKRMNDYEVMHREYAWCGSEPTPTEERMEGPRPLITDRHEDSLTVSGVGRCGRGIVARVVRLTNRRASVTLTLLDTDGTMYTLPNQPDTNFVNVDGGEGWRGGGLSITCLESMRCWRIKYNGLMRRGTRDEYITEDDGDDGDDGGAVVHAGLDLVWRAMARPVDVFNESSPRLLAHALAPEPNLFVSLFTSLERDGYDQWGAVHGEVTMEGADPQRWYLRGCRQRRWGLSETASNFHRSVDLLSYFDNGDVCALTAHSYTAGLSHYVTGYVQESNGRYRPVTSTTLSLPHLAEHSPPPTNVLTKFTTGGGSYDLWHKLGAGVTVYSGDPWTLHHQINFNAVASNHSHGWGVTIFSKRFHGLCPVPERESFPALVEPQVEVEAAPLVVSLDMEECRASCLTGGKASSLAFLTALKDTADDKYLVPRGVVATVAAWRAQLEACPELQAAVRGVETAVAHQEHLKDACARAVSAFERTPVCARVKEELLAAMSEVFPSHHTTRFAVRSSGCGEDGSEASAAGQNTTVLGVLGQDALLGALSRCWASLLTFQSVEYRRQHGQGVGVGMGVVVQEMVEAEAAGVVFSQDPVTGSPKNITITANYGLGESVVSAAAEPDTILVSRTWRGRLAVVARQLGSKKLQCVVKGAGVVEEEVAEWRRGAVCLGDDHALALARLAVFLQDNYGSPRDVEFAVCQGAIYLLQARPITTLEAWTDYELIHEHDGALLTDHELYTRGNVGEVFPGRASPLTISVVLKTLNLTFEKDSQEVIYPFIPGSAHHTRLCPTYSSVVMINMLDVQYRQNEREMGVLNTAVDMAIHGHQVTRQEFFQWGQQRHGINNKIATFYALFYLVYDRFANPGRVRRAREQFQDYRVCEGSARDAITLYREITRRLPDLVKSSYNHLCTSKFSSSTQCIAFVMLAEDRTSLSDENKADMAALLSSCTGLESADVPSALEELARVIAKNEEAEDFVGMTVDEGKVWLDSHPGLVGDTYRAFLIRHGHRCIKELDLCSVSWGMDSTALVHTLQTMVRNPACLNTPPKPVIDIAQALDNLQTPVLPKTRRALEFILPIAREAVVNREATKSLLVKVIDAFRRAYWRLGELMVSEGRLPEVDLIYFLTHPEIGQLLDTRSPALVSKAVRRRRMTDRIEGLKFPYISVGVPRPVEPSSAVVAGEGGVVLSGTVACAGHVTATARVVTSLKDAAVIQNGDILVTYSTDVGWTPYFPLLAGVVTEIGGLISHGAVVAREYGLPCVVGVSNATTTIRSGETIVLDASKGTVTRITKNNEVNAGDQDEQDNTDARQK